MNLPNLISLARLLSVPLAVYLIVESHYFWAFVAFCLAGASDAVDGFIAKTFGLTSAIGAHLDPLADKALLVGVYVSLGAQGVLPSWLVILVVSRDLLIVGGIFLMIIMGSHVKMRPLLVSKLNTAMQIALAAIVLASLAFELDIAMLIFLSIYIVAVTTVASGAAYVVEWARATAHLEEQ